MDITPNIEAIKPTKAQLRRKRYEDKTTKKICTLRAHPDKHNLIKKFARTGECNKCENTYKQFKAARNRFQKQIKFPNWSDEFTNRDMAISIYTAAFIAATYVVNEVVKDILIW